MEETLKVTFNIPHSVAWGLPIAQYFYFTGLSAGTFVISTLATVFGIKKYKPLAKYGAVLAFILLAAAPLSLIFDLEQPARFWHLFLWFNPTAVISWGTWLLSVYPVVCLIYAWYLFKEDERKSRILGIIGVPLAICVHGYTGFVFGVVKARAFWYSALMPPYFLASAFVSGFGLMILFVILKDRYWERKKPDEEIIIGLSGYLRACIIIAFIFTFCNIMILLSGSEDAYLSAIVALNDPFFIFGDLLIGYFAPLTILSIPKTRSSIKWIVVASIMTVVGVYWMRYSLVVIGQAIPLS